MFSSAAVFMKPGRWWCSI